MNKFNNFHQYSDYTHLWIGVAMAILRRRPTHGPSQQATTASPLT